ncbi:MAG: endonuclease [Micrococcales bacterium]|nr:MAG: endonuclease [Micrococcales bacterium]PIE27468.1 MAG: endonuclease [Micrococcales bacterium]
MPSPDRAHPAGDQLSLQDLGTPLVEVVFVVVDLETTGGSAQADAITEIGAVKVQGGQVLGEFHSLVDPGREIPPLVVSLTGLTTAMVRQAPRIEAVLPPFLEFITGAVLVAHNAPFDVGFLRSACVAAGQTWPQPPVLDTVRLAKHVLARDEVRNHRLATLAAHFRCATTPGHRALPDARATVEVLHGLLARLGNLGVNHLPDLLAYTSRVPARVRSKRNLADALPTGPGVYLFIGPGEEVLYVGTSVNVRRRVRSYFTASQSRRRITEMVGIARRVDAVACATVIEAQVRESRLIAAHVPRYNRKSRAPQRAPWLKLTVEPFPRLSVVRQVKPDAPDGAAYIGPFTSLRGAEMAMQAVHEALGLRQCSVRLPSRPHGGTACALLDIGRCGGPCVGKQSAPEYQRIADAARSAMTGADTGPVQAVLSAALTRLAGQQRFEDAALLRDRWYALADATARACRVGSLGACAQLVAARRVDDGGWEAVVIRHGRLAGSTRVPPRLPPQPGIEAMLATAEVTRPAPYPASAASYEETELLARWLESPGVRLVELTGTWSCPVRAAPAPR